MKIKADRIADLPDFAFFPILGGFYRRKNIIVWRDGRLTRLKNGELNYYFKLKSKRKIKDLLEANMVEVEDD